jgi:hypothetical protein
MPQAFVMPQPCIVVRGRRTSFICCRKWKSLVKLVVMKEWKNIRTALKASILLLAFTGCVTTSMLKAPTTQLFVPEDSFQYEYVYITPTSSITSGFNYNGYGSNKSINPSDVIGGIMSKKGYIRVPDLNTAPRAKTLVANYGESGRRSIGLGYSIEISIQFISAQSSEPVCSCTAEGIGDTEADDIRIAITRCLESLFR